MDEQFRVVIFERDSFAKKIGTGRGKSGYYLFGNWRESFRIVCLAVQKTVNRDFE